MIEHRVLGAMTRSEGCTHEEHYSRQSSPCYDYVISNLFSRESIVQGTGKLVQITYTKNIGFLHNDSPMPLALGLFGNESQAKLEVAYSTVSHTEEVVRRYFDKYLAILHDTASAKT